MGSDDILFLVVFIIIPTAILVSGFWLFLFLRRGRPAPAVAADASDSKEEAVSDLDELDEDDEELELDEQPTVIIDDFDKDEEEEIGPMTADLLAEGEEPLESEAETIETPILDSSGLTDEIPAMPDDALEPARVADLPDEEWQPMPAVEQDQPEEAEEAEDSTAVDCTDTTVEEADSDAAEDDDQRSPGGRLLPGRHSQGRKRRASRRAPKLRRLRRDEDSVESADGSGDVDTGDRK